MRKFKLIKEYPSCNISIGEIVTDHFSCKTLYNKGVNSFDKDQVEDFPEFWEEIIPDFPSYVKYDNKVYKVTEWTPHAYCVLDDVLKPFKHLCVPSTKEEYDAQFVKKEYEIIQFNTPENTYLYVGKMHNGCWYIFDKSAGRNYERNEKWMLEHDYKIKSIRRKSDGEIFTIGDSYRFDGNSDRQEIKGFFFTVTKELRIEGTNSYMPIKDLNKVKPLFVTEDDSLIFEGDEYWYIFDDEPTIIIHSMSAIPFKREPDIKRFSTKQAAEDYIAKSKVLFVTEDGVGIKENDSCFEITKWSIFPYACWGSYFGTNGVPLIGKIMFSTKEKAQEYIDMNKPIYSKQQVVEILRKFDSIITGETVSDSQYLDHIEGRA